MIKPFVAPHVPAPYRQLTNKQIFENGQAYRLWLSEAIEDCGPEQVIRSYLIKGEEMERMKWHHHNTINELAALKQDLMGHYEDLCDFFADGLACKVQRKGPMQAFSEIIDMIKEWVEEEEEAEHEAAEEEKHQAAELRDLRKGNWVT